MKKSHAILIALVGGFVVAVPIVAMTVPETIAPNVYIGPVAVGGLTPEEAARKLRVWWEAEKRSTMNLSHPGLRPKFSFTPGQMGVTVDPTESLADAPRSGALQAAQQAVGQGEPARKELPVRFHIVTTPVAEFSSEVKAAIPPAAPATVGYSGGAILVTKESTRMELDIPATQQNVVDALVSGIRDAGIVMREGEKSIPDEELAKITGVVASYSTRFNAGQVNRSANIRLAASFFDGKILKPGERLSYNETVGRRTKSRGFRVAGVFINGQHDTGVGGGICQVSTTLYNAALLSDLKIVRRQSHSLPVPYVPRGRDATVDYGNIDLVIENNTDGPIAIDSEYRPGQITFRVLGQPDPSRKVTIVSGRWTGASITTQRRVYRDGTLIRTDDLGRSSYYGLARKASPPRPASRPAPTAPAATTTPSPTTVPSDDSATDSAQPE